MLTQWHANTGFILSLTDL